MHRRLPIGMILALGLLVALAGPAGAHEQLVTSDPAAGVVLADPPGEVVLTFTGELTPDSGFVVIGPGAAEVGSGELDLDVAERNVLRGDLMITADGVYTVQWTGVALDLHAEGGTFTFTVGEGEAPNTAMARRLPVSVAGALLLVLAIAIPLLRQSLRATR